MSKEKQSDIRYVESLRKKADDATASANHRALVIADLTRKLEAANKTITELKLKLSKNEG